MKKIVSLLCFFILYGVPALAKRTITIPINTVHASSPDSQFSGKVMGSCGVNVSLTNLSSIDQKVTIKYYGISLNAGIMTWRPDGAYPATWGSNWKQSTTQPRAYFFGKLGDGVESVSSKTLTFKKLADGVGVNKGKATVSFVSRILTTQADDNYVWDKFKVKPVEEVEDTNENLTTTENWSDFRASTQPICTNNSATDPTWHYLCMMTITHRFYIDIEVEQDRGAMLGIVKSHCGIANSADAIRTPETFVINGGRPF